MWVSEHFLHVLTMENLGGGIGLLRLDGHKDVGSDTR